MLALFPSLCILSLISFCPLSLDRPFFSPISCICLWAVFYTFHPRAWLNSVHNFRSPDQRVSSPECPGLSLARPRLPSHSQWGQSEDCCNSGSYFWARGAFAVCSEAIAEHHEESTCEALQPILPHSPVTWAKAKGGPREWLLAADWAALSDQGVSRDCVCQMYLLVCCWTTAFPLSDTQEQGPADQSTALTESSLHALQGWTGCVRQDFEKCQLMMESTRIEQTRWITII